MRAYGKTDIGCVRTVNQDYVFCSTEPVGLLPNLFIVADGMGGHQAGDFASRFAVETFLEYVKSASPDALIRIVDDGMKRVNQRVYEAGRLKPELQGMGTTMVVAFIEDTQLYVGNVGDSRLYLIDHDIQQVTEDHSYVAAMVKAGEITEEEAKHHPDKNVITRAIGASETLKVDFFEVDLEEGDKILMCSDGLSNMVDDYELCDIITSSYITDTVDELIEEAKRNGGMDNIGVIVVDPFDKEVS